MRALIEPEGPAGSDTPVGPRWTRLAWFAGIAVAAGSAAAAFAFALKALLPGH